MSINKSVPSGQHQSIARSAAVISFATLCSRVLGFIRDMIIARIFGVYIYAQAFVIAFKIPNLLRDFMGEGAANAALVPVLSEYSVKRSRVEFWELVNLLISISLVFLSVVTLLGIVFSPLIVRVIAPGFIASPEKLEATIRLNRIIFPYILLISLASYATAILNTLKHFSVPAFAPCLLNVSIVVCALVWGEGTLGLASGILLGGVAQLAMQIPVLYRKGFRFRFCLKGAYTHPAVQTIGTLMMPRIASTGIYQLNNFVDTIFGSFAFIVGEGGVAVLYFAYRLILFPIGIFSNALSQVLLPAFSTHNAEGTPEKLTLALSWGIRCVFFVMIPTTVGYMIFSRPIVSVLFEGGRFDPYSVQLTAKALLFYSVGLCAYGGTKILQSCFFSFKDTVTPLKAASLALILNIVCNALLMFPLGTGGIALATSISGIVSFLVLFRMLLKRIHGFDLRGVIYSFLRILAASLCMGLVALWAARGMVVNKYVELVSIGLVAVGSYVFFCYLFRVKEMQGVWELVARKFKV